MGSYILTKLGHVQQSNACKSVTRSWLKIAGSGFERGKWSGGKAIFNAEQKVWHNSGENTLDRQASRNTTKPRLVVRMSKESKKWV